jgi:WD40 repeat protein
MIMAIGLYSHQGVLTVLAGYESGHAAIWQRNTTNHWQTTYVNKAHSQPILSLDSSAELKCFFTSSADAIIARYPFPASALGSQTMQTKHAGQQGLTIRSDEKIFATAGWDGKMRVYSTKNMKELAVLKWHKEGCYAVAFAATSDTNPSGSGDAESDGTTVKRAQTVAEQRITKAKSTHWLAAGSKDGKVSLWDIY